LDKTIVTGFMIIIGVIASIMVFNAVYPAIQESSDTMIRMQAQVDERMQTQIEIIHAGGELDSGGAWNDTNGDGRFNVFVWDKNVGLNRIGAIEQLDLFFGPQGNFSRVPHESDAGGSYPYWNYTLENDSNWDPTATLAITIHFSAPLSSGRYFIKTVTPNGAEDEMFLGL